MRYADRLQLSSIAIRVQRLHLQLCSRLTTLSGLKIDSVLEREHEYGCGSHYLKETESLTSRVTNGLRVIDSYFSDKTCFVKRMGSATVRSRSLRVSVVTLG